MSKFGGVPPVGENENHVDGCDLEFNESEATPDAELPAASGGVQAVHEQHENEDDTDGCDVDFSGAEATKDEELPAAAGGVA